MSRSFFSLSAAIFLMSASMVVAQQTGYENFNYKNAGIQQWYSGWYVTLHGDTIRGFIYLSNQIDNQHSFRFSAVNPPDGEVRSLQPVDVKGYRVKDRTYEALQPGMEKDMLLIQRIETGTLNLYAQYNIPEKRRDQNTETDRPVTVNDEKFHEATYLLRQGGGPVFPVPDEQHFAKEMSALLAEDKTLASYIERELNGFRHADILNIVQQYNDWQSKRQ